MSIDALPNELLAPILNHDDIPLQERIKLRAVSSRWLAVIEDALKKETKLVMQEVSELRNSAEPLLGQEYIRISSTLIPKSANDLVSDSKYFNADLVALLARLFPSVIELTMSMWSVEYFRHLPELLSKFTILKSLTLFGEYGGISSAEHNCSSTRTAKAINSLTSLTSLHLFVANFSARLAANLAPAFGRLERLSLLDAVTMNFFHPVGRVIFTSLSDRCTHLLLHDDHIDWSKVDKIAASLTHLDLTVFNHCHFDKMTEKLSLLSSLTVRFIVLTNLETHMLRHLSQLHQLTELTLLGLDCLQIAISPPSGATLPLLSVKRLRLNVIKFYGHIFDWRHFCSTLATWFSSVELLTIQFDEEFKTDVMQHLNLQTDEEFRATIKRHLNQFPNMTAICIEL